MSTYIVVAIVGIFIGLSKGGMGATLGILAIPLLSLVMPPTDAVGLSLPMLLFGDVFALYVYWNKWDMHYMRVLLPLALVGVAIGTFLLASLPSLVLRRIIGLLALSFVVYKFTSDRLLTIQYQPRGWHGYVTGVAAGTASALANSGSVPFTIYMLLQGVKPEIFAATATLFFAVLNVVRLPTQIVAGIFDMQRVLETLWVTPVIVFGVVMGRWLVLRINQKAFERFMLLVLFVASLVMIFLVPTT
ncbi:MAG TPA: sulfite exporter TauE/SafE family protein [Oceanobacillus sp.]|nr:sulfite exporter TauE/SafE family protein [Oceanobacillus sp.]